MVTFTVTCKPPRTRAPAPDLYLFTSARDRRVLVEAPRDRHGQPVMSKARTYYLPADFTDFQRDWFVYGLLHGRTPRGVPIEYAGRAPRFGRPGEHERIQAALNAKGRECAAGTTRSSALPPASGRRRQRRPRSSPSRMSSAGGTRK